MPCRATAALARCGAAHSKNGVLAYINIAGILMPRISSAPRAEPVPALRVQQSLNGRCKSCPLHDLLQKQAAGASNAIIVDINSSTTPPAQPFPFRLSKWSVSHVMMYSVGVCMFPKLESVQCLPIEIARCDIEVAGDHRVISFGTSRLKG